MRLTSRGRPLRSEQFQKGDDVLNVLRQQDIGIRDRKSLVRGEEEHVLLQHVHEVLRRVVDRGGRIDIDSGSIRAISPEGVGTAAFATPDGMCSVGRGAGCSW